MLTEPPASPGESPTPPVESSPPGRPCSSVVYEQRWLARPAIALERLPWPFWLTVVLVAGFALGEQILEYSMEQTLVGGQPTLSIFRLVVSPVLMIYILVNFHLLKKYTVAELTRLRPAVLVSDQEYDEHVKRMVIANPRVEFVLLLVSAVVVLVFFVAFDLDLLNTNRGLPQSLPLAIYIIVMYILLGWLLLAIVYNSLRQAQALSSLARCPLLINGFDLINLLPFGRLGLIQSLPTVGIVLVPLILLGTPTKAGFLVIFLSVVGFLALFVPLWGVHVQIVQSHERNLSAIHAQLQEIKDILLAGLSSDPSYLTSMNNRVTMLINLRKTIQEAPNWPFKDSATVARAIVAVTSPFFYFIINELIRTYVFPVLVTGR